MLRLNLTSHWTLQKFVCLTLPHPLRTTLNHISPQLDTCIWLSETAAQIQNFSFRDEPSVPPTLSFSQGTSEVWLLTDPCSEINRAKFFGDWKKSAINLPISSIYLKHLGRDAHFQMHGATSACCHMCRCSLQCTSLLSSEQTIPLITLSTCKENF